MFEHKILLPVYAKVYRSVGKSNQIKLSVGSKVFGDMSNGIWIVFNKDNFSNYYISEN